MMIRECMYCFWNECLTPEAYEKRLAEKSTHGGAGRGQGRNRLKEGEETVSATLRMSASQKEKLARLGGAAWVRAQIDAEEEPIEIGGLLTTL